MRWSVAMGRLRFAVEATRGAVGPDQTPTDWLEQLRDSLERHPNLAPDAQVAAGDIREALDSIAWYHTIDLPGGIVTPGVFDHRPIVPQYGIPEDLTGCRVLDVGSWDGFWAFEFERRGAEVTAIDIGQLSAADLPRRHREALVASGLDMRIGVGFEIARRALGSKVQRVIGSVYRLDPDELGMFDLVHFANVLEHLRDPMVALEQIRRVTRGHAIIVNRYDERLDPDVLMYRGGEQHQFWWRMPLNVLGRMLDDAGFGNVSLHTTYQLGVGPNSHHCLYKAAP